MTSSIYEWSVKYLASETVVLVLKPLILLLPKSAKYFMYNITDLLPGNKISSKFYIRPRKPKPVAYHIAELQSVRSFSTFCLFYLFYFFLFRFFTISRKSADYSTLRFSFSIAQHIQNNEGTCVVLRFLEALFSPHNLTSGHDYCRFWAKRNCEIITMLLRKSSVWSICCSLSFLNTNEQLIFMRFCVR